MRNLLVEISDVSLERRCFLARNFEEMESELSKFINKEIVDAILYSLSEQTKDPNLFPNVILFKNGNNFINFDEYISLNIDKKWESSNANSATK